MEKKNIKREIIKKGRFPRISRFITEKIVFLNNKQNFLISLLSFGLFVCIVFVVLDLNKNIQQKKEIETQRREISSQINFWQEATNKYKGYRDAYFKLAVLEYKLGNNDKSQFYLQKTFSLDPNFVKGRVLEKMLNQENY